MVGFDKGVSHFDWRDDKQIIATYAPDGGGGKKHVLFSDGLKDHKVIGEGFLDFDGHCSFGPDRNVLVTDHKHKDSKEQSLLTYDLGTKKGRVVCRLDMHDRQFMSGDVRCDFHPRWNRAGDEICFDALESGGTRQVHIARLKGV